MITKLEVYSGDITKLKLDAIVNAANRTLLGGGGVDGAIHRVAGNELYEECRILNGCNTGEAKITKGYNLPAKHVIHTVGPIWKGGYNNEANSLADCYENSLVLAVENNLKTIAFPSISTGVYGYPKLQACLIAINTVIGFLKNNNLPSKVVFVCFDRITEDIYRKNLSKMLV